jgi:ribulose-bisphosphate carboxylase large chain
MDFELPDSFKNHFKGPKFGIKGSKLSCGVGDRPMIGTIIKPSIGMSIDETATLVKSLIDAGIDFIKDDELMGSAANSPFDERVKAIMKVIRDNEQKTGKKVMYAFNISDEIDEMQRKYDLIKKEEGSCAMISVNSVGLSGAKKICDQGDLVIHGHRNGWGMLNRHPLLGIEFPAYQKIQRLAGVDQLHVNGIQNKFWESDDSVVTSIQSCLKPFLGGYEVLAFLLSSCNKPPTQKAISSASSTGVLTCLSSASRRFSRHSQTRSGQRAGRRFTPFSSAGSRHTADR